MADNFIEAAVQEEDGTETIHEFPIGTSNEEMDRLVNEFTVDLPGDDRPDPSGRSEDDLVKVVDPLMPTKPKHEVYDADLESEKTVLSNSGDTSRNFIYHHEGNESKQYKDSDGFSIGAGHFITKKETKNGKILIGGENVDYKKGLTDAQIDTLYEQDVEKFSDAATEMITQGELNHIPNIHTAVTSLLYNIGIARFKRSNAYKALVRGNLPTFQFEAFDSKMGFVKSEGEILPGLVNRRAAELALMDPNRGIERTQMGSAPIDTGTPEPKVEKTTADVEPQAPGNLNEISPRQKPAQLGENFDALSGLPDGITPTTDLSLVPEPVRNVLLAATKGKDGLMTNKDYSPAVINVLQRAKDNAVAAGETSINYEHYPLTARGLTASALVGKNMSAEETAARKKAYPKNAIGAARLIYDLQTDPVVRTAWSIGGFSLTKDGNIHDRFNFNSANKTKDDWYAWVRNVLSNSGMMPILEGEGPISDIKLKSSGGSDDLLIGGSGKDTLQDGAYTIVSGDTLGRVAKDNGFTLAEIMQANPNIKDANKIGIGQKINIPGAAPALEEQPEPENIGAPEGLRDVRPRSKPVQNVDPGPLEGIGISIKPAPITPTQPIPKKVMNTQQVNDAANIIMEESLLGDFKSSTILPNFVGTHAAVALQHMKIGLKERLNLPITDEDKAPITEKSIDPDLLNIIKVATLRAFKERRTTNYAKDYGDAAKLVYGNLRGSNFDVVKNILGSFFDPTAAAGLTIGESSGIKVNERGHLVLQNDEYNFPEIGGKKSDAWLVMQRLFSDKTGLFGVKNKKNRIKINFDFGPVKDIEEYVVSLSNKKAKET